MEAKKWPRVSSLHMHLLNCLYIYIYIYIVNLFMNEFQVWKKLQLKRDGN
jgi:hypothetical protein